MEELLKQVIGLLVGVIVLLAIIATCQIVLVVDAIEPPAVRAKSQSIQKCDIVKIGGNYVYLYDLIKKPGQK